jgi:hypothetical protein
MNGKQARALRKIAQLNTEDKASSKIANNIIKKGFKQFKRSGNVGRTK